MTEIVAALDALSSGIAAARVLELDIGPAEAAHQEATERLGIAPDSYVLALVGGTGVGKSTLLNALAGETVSPASAKRPTTGRPVAWVSADTAEEIRPLLERLDVESVRTHQRAGLERVVVLDLPDVDSLDETHRTTVEAILPKVDVVAWVTDPEKYADAVLHDDFLRTWMARLDRQIVVLNKTDRLGPVAVRSVAADLAHVLKRELPSIQSKSPAVVRAAAIDGESGVSELRRWLAGAVDAKKVVADRLVAAARAALAGLAAAAGVTAAGAPPLVSVPERAIAIDRATFEVLRVADLAGAQKQAVAATRARARWRGTGPIGLITSVAYRLAGRERRSADPGGYLRAWRTRGTLTRAADAVRKTMTDAMPNVAPGLRARFSSATEAGTLERRLETAFDRVVARQPDLEAPVSRLWPLLGSLQTLNTVFLVFATAWVVVWILVRPAVASFEVPVLGPIPAPMVLLALLLAVGYVLARILSLHAGWLGGRWAKRLTSDLSDAVREAVTEEAFAPIDRIEEARTNLAAAWRQAGSAAGSSGESAAGSSEPAATPTAPSTAGAATPPTASPS